MITMPLTQGKTTIVDDDVFDLVQGYKWHASLITKKWYAVCKIKERTTYMHRIIVCPAAGMQVDHINGDSLDNRRINLRQCTPRQQSMNTRSKREGKRFKGVRKGSGKNWQAYICAGRKMFSLGAFSSEELAAKAYDEAALVMHGAFAKLNFPR